MSDPTDPSVDPYAGQGGAYVVDPVTQERVLVDRTIDPETDRTDPQPE
jgi:hypothetical protein